MNQQTYTTITNLAVAVMCSMSCCAPAAEGGGEADQQLIGDGMVANRRKLRPPALCWNRQLCHFKKNIYCSQTRWWSLSILSFKVHVHIYLKEKIVRQILDKTTNETVCLWFPPAP